MADKKLSRALNLKVLIALFFISILILGQPSSSQNIKLNKEWTTNIQSFLESAPTVADINNDGRDEVLYGQSRSVIDNLASEDMMDRFREEMIECVRSVLKNEK